MINHTNRGAYGRRDVPGSRTFCRSKGTIYVGTREGVRRHKLTPGSLVASLDVDPHSVKWPVKDAGICLCVDDRKHEEFSTRVVMALLDDGAQLVVRIFMRDGSATYHRPAGIQCHSGTPE